MLARTLELLRAQRVQLTAVQDKLSKDTFDAPDLHAIAQKLVKNETINLDLGTALAPLQRSAGIR